MNIELLVAVIGVVGTLLGTALGWTLNCVYDSRNKKVKLCYSLQPIGDEELLDIELRSKYSASGYCLHIYNIGQTPFLFEQISLQYKKTTINECVNVGEEKAIMPYKCYTYQLNMQEYDNILYHCKEGKLKECNVIAYDLGGRKCKGKLDLVLQSMQTGVREMRSQV